MLRQDFIWSWRLLLQIIAPRLQHLDLGARGMDYDFCTTSGSLVNMIFAVLTPGPLVNTLISSIMAMLS